LGVEQLWALSADHSYGFGTLMNALVEKLGTTEAPPELPESTIRLAFLGRPNVGKSSMINAIMGQERMIVSEVAGTTRDSVDTLLTRDEHSYPGQAGKVFHPQGSQIPYPLRHRGSAN
jgi:GTP-binding protein